MSTKTKPNAPIERPPVIAVMGHIDHGKSTLLDHIRKTNIVDKEAGGITQHIAAYEVTHLHNGTQKKITFIDTPGHEAFAAVRSRGANIADIAILVVSAEDGVKPQTLEALKFIKQSETPFVVALTKIDKQTADVDRARQSLAENEIYVEGYGGDIPCVAVSAKTGQGIPELLDMLTIMAELEELTGDATLPAEGFVVEATLDMKKGVAATLIIKNGSLKSGMAIVAGHALVPVRIMEDFLGNKISGASFSSPVRLIGWSEVPPTGSPFVTLPSKRDAEKFIEDKEQPKQKEREPKNENLEESTVVIPIVIKADTVGSIEAIQHELKKMTIERVRTKIVHTGVGDISEGDIKAAAGVENPLIVGFNVNVDSRLGQLPERIGAEIKTFDIIYRLTEWLTETLSARAPKITVEEFKAQLKVLKTFSRNKNTQVIGGKVEKGTLSSGDKVRIHRRESIIGDALIKELQHMKDKVREVEEGKECGLLVESKMEIMPGDRLEAFMFVER